MPGEIFIQLVVDFADDEKVRALARYGRAARGCRDLYVQMICYSRRMLTDGFVPAEQIGILAYPDPPRVGLADAARLVEVGLVEQRGDRYFLPGYVKRNRTRSQVESLVAAKAGGAAWSNHQRWHVARGRRDAACPLCVSTGPGAGGDDPGVAPAIGGANGAATGERVASDSTETETETELTTTTAAAASAKPPARRTREKPPPPPELEPLRQALDAAGLVVRWDKLGEERAAEAVRLLGVHGVPALVETARANFRPDRPPAYAQAWIGAWQALPEPGRLQAVPAKCAEHRLPEPCRSCAADRLAGAPVGSGGPAEPRRAAAEPAAAARTARPAGPATRRAGTGALSPVRGRPPDTTSRPLDARVHRPAAQGAP